MKRRRQVPWVRGERKRPRAGVGRRRVRPNASERRRPDAATARVEAQATDRCRFELGAADPLPRRVRGRIRKDVDTGADIALGTRVGLTGGVPENAVRVLEVAGREREQAVADHRPRTGAGIPPPDPAVGARGPDVAGAVGRETGDAPRDEPVASARVRREVAIRRVVGVVGDGRDVLPRATRRRQIVQVADRGRVRAGIDDAGRRSPRVHELLLSRHVLVRLVAAAVRTRCALRLEAELLLRDQHARPRCLMRASGRDDAGDHRHEDESGHREDDKRPPFEDLPHVFLPSRPAHADSG